ncbi:MAG: hypothetical protein AAGD18_11655, partial [Actinomycetota bacterium]
ARAGASELRRDGHPRDGVVGGAVFAHGDGAGVVAGGLVDNDRANADPVVVNLPAGDHTLTFAVREDGAALDTIALVPVAP